MIKHEHCSDQTWYTWYPWQLGMNQVLTAFVLLIKLVLVRSKKQILKEKLTILHDQNLSIANGFVIIKTFPLIFYFRWRCSMCNILNYSSLVFFVQFVKMLNIWLKAILAKRKAFKTGVPQTKKKCFVIDSVSIKVKNMVAILNHYCNAVFSNHCFMVPLIY